MKPDSVLSDHGTGLMILRPRSIVQAAHADIRRRARNAEKGADRSKNFGTDAYEPYAFHRTHVRKASDAHDLMVRALMEPVPGLQSDKYNTRLIYGDGALLREAIMLAGE